MYINNELWLPKLKQVHILCKMNESVSKKCEEASWPGGKSQEGVLEWWLGSQTCSQMTNWCKNFCVSAASDPHLWQFYRNQKHSLPLVFFPQHCHGGSSLPIRIKHLSLWSLLVLSCTWSCLLHILVKSCFSKVSYHLPQIQQFVITRAKV